MTLKCKQCYEEVKMEMYESGLELYCKCQCTLQAEFDENLWEEISE